MNDDKLRMGRRAFLGLAAGLSATLLLLKNEPGCAAPAEGEESDGTIRHSMWVWRFDVDGSPDRVLQDVRDSGMSIVLKTNDGADWMSRYDDSATAITGAQKVREMADYFESAGVPFHAWCVVHGLDPVGEAQICAEVLANGARSMTFDLEPSDGSNYWQGEREAALVLGQELRRLQPQAHLGVAPDARPWQIDAVPTAEFATFVDEINPQSYWRTFEGPSNRRRIAEAGHSVGPDGITPELILDVTVDKLRQFNLPVRPLGQGAANGAEWERFVNHAYGLQIDSVGVWRYGTTDGEVWPALKRLAPQQLAAAPAASDRQEDGGDDVAAEPEQATAESPQASPTPEQEAPAAEATPAAVASAEPPEVIASAELSRQPDAPRGVLTTRLTRESVSFSRGCG